MYTDPAFTAHVLQDGGCTCPGDVAKAFGAGADFVMVGGMLAGHDESGGEVIERNGKKLKLFYGMASATAMKMYAGGVADYRYVVVTELPLVREKSGNFVLGQGNLRF